VSKLTYIVPVFNGAPTIERTILSLLDQQAGPAPSVIVVDDGSTDGAAQIIRRYSGRLHFIEQPNAGPSAARNRGLAAAQTEIVCFVDADDYVLGPHCSAIESIWRPDLDMAITLAAIERDDGIVLHNSNKYAEAATPCDLLRRFILDDCVQTSTICWSTDFLRRIGGWNEAISLSEDIELAMRAFLRDPHVMTTDLPAWVVWNDRTRPGRLSRQMTPQAAASLMRVHVSINGELERSAVEPDLRALFYKRCVELARRLSLNGYATEADVLFKLARSHGFTGRGGPWSDQVLAALLGDSLAFRIRGALGKAKRLGMAGKRMPGSLAL
jgi:glycosyltransferase involved in cell wall biosynthesis